MKQELTVAQLGKINWILLGLYLVFIVVQWILTSSGGMDAAGRGMARGFLLVYLAVVLVVAGLNLIPRRWMRVLVLILCLSPFILAFLNLLS